jgi:hypothetical protein
VPKILIKLRSLILALSIISLFVAVRTLYTWAYSPDLLMPHGWCIQWNPWIMGPDIVAQLITWISYIGIPFILYLYMRGTKAGNSPAWVTWAFIIFIFSCGTGHLVDVITYWIPAYRLRTAVNSVTALASLATLVALPVWLKQMLSRPSYKDLEIAIAEMRQAKNDISTASSHPSEDLIYSAQRKLDSAIARMDAIYLQVTTLKQGTY